MFDFSNAEVKTYDIGLPIGAFEIRATRFELGELSLLLESANQGETPWVFELRVLPVWFCVSSDEMYETDFQSKVEKEGAIEGFYEIDNSPLIESLAAREPLFDAFKKGARHWAVLSRIECVHLIACDVPQLREICGIKK